MQYFTMLHNHRIRYFKNSGYKLQIKNIKYWYVFIWTYTGILWDVSVLYWNILYNFSVSYTYCECIHTTKKICNTCPGMQISFAMYWRLRYLGTAIYKTTSCTYFQCSFYFLLWSIYEFMHECSNLIYPNRMQRAKEKNRKKLPCIKIQKSRSIAKELLVLPLHGILWVGLLHTKCMFFKKRRTHFKLPQALWCDWRLVHLIDNAFSLRWLLLSSLSEMVLWQEVNWISSFSFILLVSLYSKILRTFQIKLR